MVFELYTHEGGDDFFQVMPADMGRLRLLLEAFDIIDWEMAAGDWPEPDPVKAKLIDSGDESAVLEWEVDVMMPWRRRRSSDPAKVPAFKFLTTDGWWITSEECVLLADALDGEVSGALELKVMQLLEAEPCKDLLAPHERLGHTWSLGRKFGKFCREAAEQGGFHVW